MCGKTNKRYKLRGEYTEETIEELGFRYSRVRSDDENPVYLYRFPVYRHLDTILLECWMTFYFNTGELKIDVMDVYNGMHGKYCTWYHYEYGDYTPILDIIDNKIKKELKRLEAEPLKEEEEE